MCHREINNLRPEPVWPPCLCYVMYCWERGVGGRGYKPCHTLTELLTFISFQKLQIWRSPGVLIVEYCKILKYLVTGILPQWRQVPATRFPDAMGLHEGGDWHHLRWTWWRREEVKYFQLNWRGGGSLWPDILHLSASQYFTCNILGFSKSWGIF